MGEEVDLDAAVRRAWNKLAPLVTWRGVATGMHAVDLLTLGELVHQVAPALVVVAGGVGRGGLAYFLADCLDDNRRGRLVAGEKMSVERRRILPEHRRIQWMAQDLIVEDFHTARRLANAATPTLVVADSSVNPDVLGHRLGSLVTVGSYLVVHGDSAFEAMRFPPPPFLPDPSRDPAGLSACTWLLRVPA